MIRFLSALRLSKRYLPYLKVLGFFILQQRHGEEDMDHKPRKDEQTGRIVAFLTREEIDFIDSLSKDAMFSTGHRLSRTDIVRAMIDAIRVRVIDANGVRSKSDLEKKLLHLMHIALPESAADIAMKRPLR